MKTSFTVIIRAAVITVNIYILNFPYISSICGWKSVISFRAGIYSQMFISLFTSLRRKSYTPEQGSVAMSVSWICPVIFNDLVEYPALNMMVNNLYQLYTEEGGRKFLQSLCNALA
jgi:hypothetical protein